MTAPDGAIRDLSDRFAACFPRRLAAPRTVGREAEFPLVTPDGRAGDAARVWPLLIRAGCDPILDRVPGGPPGDVIGVRGDRWESLVEVGRCTVEVVVGPRRSLTELRADFDGALATLLPAVHRAGYRLLGHGIQPRTPPAPRLMAPKRRYPVMSRATEGRWVRWCVTASDQVHVAVSRGELIPLLNVMNGLAGAVIALTANSSVYAGRPGRFASRREALMEGVTGEPHRHGALPRPFADVEDWVRFVLGFRCLFLPDDRGGYVTPDRPMGEILAEHPGLDPFLFHDHYLWPSVRPRARLGTVEVRPACQQPPGESWAAAALALGLAEAHREAAGLISDRWGSAPTLRRFRRAAVRDGLRAVPPAPGFLDAVVDLAEGGLRGRGLGEDELLRPVRERIQSGTGPADRARALMNEQGIRGLVAGLSLR